MKIKLGNVLKLRFFGLGYDRVFIGLVLGAKNKPKSEPTQDALRRIEDEMFQLKLERNGLLMKEQQGI